MIRPVDVVAKMPRPDCAHGVHVSVAGKPCVCGDAGPPLAALRTIKLAPVRKPEPGARGVFA